MLVEFKFPWFGPTKVVVKDKIQHVSGKRYKRGVHEVPDELRDLLPKTAKVLNEKPKEVKKEIESTDIKDYDQERKDADHFAKVAEKAEKEYKTLKEQRQERMAHAREVLKEKKEAEKKE